MNIHPDDPKWTAYVLGELSDAERAEVERELESSVEAREIVDEIRLMTTLLKDELAKEVPVGLRPEQRASIVQASRRRGRFSGVPRWIVAGAGALVAAMALISVSMPSLLRSRQSAVPAISLKDSRETGVNAPLPLPQSSPFQESQLRSRPSNVVQNDVVLKTDSLKSAPGAESAKGPVLTGVMGGVLRPSAIPAPPPPPPPSERVRVDNLRKPDFNTEAYDRVDDNPFKTVAENPLATFSVDVDTASYANTRRFLNQNQLPPKDAVRIEELINYFNYEYPQPTGRHPIAVLAEVAASPWQPAHRLVRIGIKAKDIDTSRRPPGNLVFLIDVSGSMMSPDKLPLLKSSLKLLVDRLTENDRVAIVVYAGMSGLVLPPTSGDKKEQIIQTLDRLEAGGSTNGASGIQLAYNTAVAGFVNGGVNRVILCTDGDFNVGVTNQGDLTRLIEEKAKSGVFLSVLGFGMGNLKDSTMEKLADRGNGNYAYIDSLNEGRKVLVEEMSGTLMTVAKDVKIQVDFNAAEVNAYRLIGYENRALRNEDFNDDTKDAGDMGAGQTVTALFEIVPRGAGMSLPPVEPSKYQSGEKKNAGNSNELLSVRVRYKGTDSETSVRFDVPLVDRRTSFENASLDFRFAAAVAEFGMILRDSPHKGSGSMDHAIRVIEGSRGPDRNGYREEFLRLVRKARALKEGE